MLRIRFIQLTYIRLCGLLLAVIGWVLCVIATGADEWRVWHSKDVPGTSPAKIWVGIWRVCFVDHPPEGEPTRQCQEFLEQHQSLPTEILIAQDLMPFAIVVLSLALVCMFFALWNVFRNARPEKVFLTFFRVGGVLILMSAFIIFIPLMWNIYSVMVNERIVFPGDFSLPALPNEQTVGFPIYVGFFASGFQVTIVHSVNPVQSRYCALSALIFWDIWLCTRSLRPF
uniref:Uncharacterized protein n=1 Tax=Anolis carolinensis TaxID=28377 RepID=A0A803TBM4_ANOCA